MAGAVEAIIGGIGNLCVPLPALESTYEDLISGVGHLLVIVVGYVRAPRGDITFITAHAAVSVMISEIPL